MQHYIKNTIWLSWYILPAYKVVLCWYVPGKARFSVLYLKPSQTSGLRQWCVTLPWDIYTGWELLLHTADLSADLSGFTPSQHHNPWEMIAVGNDAEAFWWQASCCEHLVTFWLKRFQFSATRVLSEQNSFMNIWISGWYEKESEWLCNFFE